MSIAKEFIEKSQYAAEAEIEQKAKRDLTKDELLFVRLAFSLGMKCAQDFNQLIRRPS